MFTSGMQLKSEYESGYVYQFSDCSVYVPDSVEDSEKVAEQAGSLNQSSPEAATRLESEYRDARSASEKAELLALLHDRVDGWVFDHAAVTDTSATIPIPLAVEGNAAIAAYLAVHGLSNDEIADQMGVGKRTVSQYISDLKSGER